MIINFILFFGGIFFLIKSADVLIKGSSSLARRFGVSAFIIGLTIVAFGTSSPEMAVTIVSSIKGSNDLVLGNIIGSNIFNIGFIIALSSIMIPLKIKTNTVWKEIPMSLLGVFALIFLGVDFLDKNFFPAFFDKKKDIVGIINWSDGLILLSFFLIFIYYVFGTIKNNKEESVEIERLSIKKSIFFVAGGILGLAFSSSLVVDNAIVIARNFNVSEKLIGLTLMSSSTSLPELVTNLVAVYKKETDIAVGNIIGSNIFNIFFILGAVSLINPVFILDSDFFHILILIVITLLLLSSFIIFNKRHLDRFEGFFILFFYFFYLISLIFLKI